MGSIRNTLFLLLTLSLGGFFSCKDDDPSNQVMPSNQVNQWIYAQMGTYYLWNNHLPVRPSLNQTPDKFFYSICYRYDKNTNPDGDRFSFISDNYENLENQLSGISSDEIGFEYSLGIFSGSNVFGQIEYVKKGTPAKNAGIKRGQLFTKINGTQLTTQNVGSVLFGLKGSYSLTLHNAEQGNDGYYHFSDTITKTLSTVSSYKDDPILLDSIYTIDNKMIGYLVYNFFADDSNDKSLSFDVELKTIFEKFRDNNISDLVVDLRYNSGGSVNAAQCMSSMIVKNRNTSNVFLRSQYNSLITEEIMKDPAGGAKAFYLQFIDKITPQSKPPVSLPNIGNQLNNLVFLTGPNTASASEMVINGLRPYGMNITLIGDTTIGKNVGSITIHDEENSNKNKWAIQPIIVKFYNANDQSDFTAGFVPDKLNEDQDLVKAELGDRNESLLADAIARITGKPYILRSSVSQDKLPKMIDSSIKKKVWSNKIILQRNQLPKFE